MKEQNLVSSDDRLDRLTYSIAETAVVLGISKANAAALVHSAGFPAFRRGRRILVKREKLKEWVENQPEGLNDRYVRRRESAK